MKIFLEWTTFKLQIINKGKLRFVDRDVMYLCYYNDLETSILKDSGSDQTDFETNYKSLANKSVENLDTDGAVILRPKAAKAGWTYFLCPIEFTTSKLASVVSKQADNTDRSGITYKIYNSSNVEITDSADEATATKTVVDFEPSYDYEVIGGQIQQHTKPTSDIRVWVIGVPDISEAYGGSKEMVGGVNLKYIDPTDKVSADGRVTKYLAYNATYHTNKLRLIIRHDAGIQHDLLLVLEMFKA
jgi:hypothetical protein